MFFILKQDSGSWFFTDFLVGDVNTQIAVFLLAFLGFGIKAGFMPFHFWLPQAHPIAPSFLSAFLSGVIIKLGIYGIIRSFLFLANLPEFFAWIVIAISLFSAIMGVWYALAQHDIKRLLAFTRLKI
jgi:formate hydrogenlyase subunit 3/multisubunit Na+/H+ antiporter MnhD subunit